MATFVINPLRLKPRGYMSPPSGVSVVGIQRGFIPAGIWGSHQALASLHLYFPKSEHIIRA